MTDLSKFDPNGPANPKNNIFGLPFTEEDARLVILPVPWEVTVSSGAGTSRTYEHVFQAALQVDLLDTETDDAWRHGLFMRQPDKKILMRSDYLRKEAELYINFTSRGEIVQSNSFMCKSLKEINEGGHLLNKWVYDQTRALLDQDKLIGLLGGDHSTALGYFKAIGEKHGDFGILQIDAHADLRKSYEDFIYSHASIMYNALQEVPQLKRLVQAGVRDYCKEEWEFVRESKNKVVTYYDKYIRERLYEGQSWKHIADELVSHLPEKVYVSFDVDGLDPKLCPNTGTPVPGGFELEQVYYLIRRIIQSGRRFIGFDLVEIGVGDTGLDANVGARILWKLSNLLIGNNS